MKDVSVLATKVKTVGSMVMVMHYGDIMTTTTMNTGDTFHTKSMRDM